ncbi:hypothetical protein HDU92_007670 [Lobulomyces angularis]|nr:hypothetical protein HDU92_007670 [Lobulomyces angularis]
MHASYAAYLLTTAIKCSPPSNFNLLPSLRAFIKSLSFSDIYLSTAIIYISRIKFKKGSKGLPDTHYRLFLASIITAHKFLDDNSYKNKLWSDLNGKLFSCKDINLMERQFLSMLDYNLMVSQEEYDSLNSKLLSTFKLHQQKPLINSTFNIKTNDFYSCNSQNLILPPILSSNSFSRASSYDTLSSSLSSSNLDSDIDDLDELLDSISIGSNNTPNLSHFSP